MFHPRGPSHDKDPGMLGEQHAGIDTGALQNDPSDLAPIPWHKGLQRQCFEQLRVVHVVSDILNSTVAV